VARASTIRLNYKHSSVLSELLIYEQILNLYRPTSFDSGTSILIRVPFIEIKTGRVIVSPVGVRKLTVYVCFQTHGNWS